MEGAGQATDTWDSAEEVEETMQSVEKNCHCCFLSLLTNAKKEKNTANDMES